MSFVEQLLIYQGIAALHAIIRRYATKYFTPEELTACDTALDAISDLPQRIHAAQAAVPVAAAPTAPKPGA